MENETKIKPKKPIWKKWWFWVIVIFIVITIIGSSSSEQEVKPEQQSSQQQAQQAQTQEKTEDKKQADARQALIEKRQKFDPKRGNNYEAASTAQGFINLLKTEMPNLEVDMYLRLTAPDKDEKAYKNGGDLTRYRNSVYAAELFIVMDGQIWDASTDSDKKDLVAGFVNALHTLYSNSTTISVKVNNGIRTVAEGNWNLWHGEAEVKLK